MNANNERSGKDAAEFAARIAPRHRPPLDPGFVPACLWRRAYGRLVEERGNGVSVTLAVGQPGGAVARFTTQMLPDEPANDGLNYRHLERILKFLLWSRGGNRVWVAGAPRLAARLGAAYSEGGERRFDAEFLGRRIYLAPMEVIACGEDEAPAAAVGAAAGGGGLDGCRIGFDLGGSDRKAAALVDGRVVFSEEIGWDPYFQKDSEYHYAGIQDSLKRAAAHLPRVDAIGGSAAGVYVDNEPRVASLFRGVPEDVFAARVRPMFKRIAAEWGVPFRVANDGDVTALAAARMLGAGRKGGVLGLAFGTSLAAGYVTPEGTLTPWLNELAFVPVDYRAAAEGGHVDEWSGDAGTGVRYHSQQALAQFLSGDETGVDLAAPLPEKLVALQRGMAEGRDWAARVYDSYGVYLGYSLVQFADFYDFAHVCLLGRVMSGAGGDRMREKAREVLRDEAPGLWERVEFVAPDETFKRHGQAIAAASLP